jgi:glyoxylase-like metal-dependent hydrolase (beta-lactamase superfamily II)
MSLRHVIVPVTPFQQNCALIWNEATGEGAVIDPGADVPNILAAIAAYEVKVTAIYLTHGHLDHAGGANELAEALSIPIIGPGVEDEFLLAGIAVQAANFGFRAQNCTPTRYLAEGEQIDIGGIKLDVVHCPGHTPGHVVFLDRAAKFGILGDVLFRNSVGRTDFPYGNTEQLLTAIRDKLLVLPDDFTFICGHGAGSTIGAEKRSNPFL